MNMVYQYTIHQFQNTFYLLQFFDKKGVPDLPGPVHLFSKITGMKFPEENTNILNAIQNYEKSEELLVHGNRQTTEAFDYIFEKMSKSLDAKKEDNSCD